MIATAGVAHLHNDRVLRQDELVLVFDHQNFDPSLSSYSVDRAARIDVHEARQFVDRIHVLIEGELLKIDSIYNFLFVLMLERFTIHFFSKFSIIMMMNTFKLKLIFDL